MSFNISDKVVCVDDKNWRHQHLDIEQPNGLPVKGCVYCVSGMRNSEAVTLVGLPGIHRPTGIDIGYMPSRFRLLSEIKAANAARIASHTLTAAMARIDANNAVIDALLKDLRNPYST